MSLSSKNVSVHTHLILYGISCPFVTLKEGALPPYYALGWLLTSNPFAILLTIPVVPTCVESGRAIAKTPRSKLGKILGKCNAVQRENCKTQKCHVEMAIALFLCAEKRSPHIVDPKSERRMQRTFCATVADLFYTLVQCTHDNRDLLCIQ